MSGDTTQEYEGNPEDPEGFHGSFARLRPINEPAKRAFHHAFDLVHAGSLDSKTSSHLIQFMTIERQVDGIWEGFFGLDMSKRSRSAGTWIFGSDPYSVDLLLCLSDSSDHPSPSGVYPAHGQLFQDQHGATLMIRCTHAKADVYVDQAEAVSTNGRMLAPNTGVTIGVLLFKLEFAPLSRAQLLGQISSLRRQNDHLEYPALLSPTPSASSQCIQGEFLVGNVTHGGAQGSVSFVHRLHGGRPAVCKKFTVHPRNAAKVQLLRSEVSLLTRLSNEENIVHIADGFNVQTALSPLHSANQVVEILIIIEPAATHTLQDLLSNPVIGAKYNIWNIRGIARDWATGLAVIHKLPALHADLKPSNLGMTTFLGVVLDLGHAIEGEVSDNHGAGTIPYLAPEIMARKRSDPSIVATHCVTPSSDVYSLGLSLALWILKSRSPPWDGALSSDLGVRRDLLEQYVQAPLSVLKNDPPPWVQEGDYEAFKDFVDTVKIMLNADPKYRLTASDAAFAFERSEDFSPSPGPIRSLCDVGERSKSDSGPSSLGEG